MGVKSGASDVGGDGRKRCDWVAKASDRMLAYHDRQWGVPLRDDRQLYAKLVLDGAQAGLSWSTILDRERGYYRAFDRLDPKKVARYGDAEVARLLADPGIIRNRAKVRSAIQNAQAFLRLQKEEGSFSHWLWGFVDGRPLQNRWRRPGQRPAETPLAQAISKELRTRGFSFVGPTIVYASMQAIGMVNDHLIGCFRHAEVAAMATEGSP
ncbi:MAG TPA: DNA-3-methyladenine glycosylase I [Thermoanaerobaculia bacterium]|nr:DNA-3-methyladenine glycosylase I [Thermoanaerobaculia bacterium]